MSSHKILTKRRTRRKQSMAEKEGFSGMKRLALALSGLLFFATPPAHAQLQGAVQQSGNITVGNPACWLGSFLIGDSGCTAPARSLAPGTTTISPSTNGGVLYDNAGVLGDSTTLPSGLTIPGATLNGSTSVNGALAYANSLVYSSDAPSATNSYFFLPTTSSLTGTVATPVGGIISPFRIWMADGMNTTSAGTGSSYGLSVQLLPTTNHTGNRASILGWMQVQAAAAGGLNEQYVGLIGIATTTHNLNGVDGALANWKGAIFGGNSNAFTGSGATFLALLTAHEFDVTSPAGTSEARKAGILIVQGDNDAVRGNFEDQAIEIANQANAATTWKTGLGFGSYSSKWAFGADSTLIAAIQRGFAPIDSPIALNGVDFSAVTFQAGGCAYKSAGFCVDPSGNITTQSTPLPRVLGNSGIPFVMLSGNGSTVGNMGNNGSITALTAVPTAYANAYCYVPANAIAAGSTAGWYYCTFGSTTTATLFNNTYDTTACGTPTIPGSPTAFSTTGPGFFTQTAGVITAFCAIVPANAMGNNGSIAITASMTYNNSAGSKVFRPAFDTVTICTPSNTTTVVDSISTRLINRGRPDAQVSLTSSTCSLGNQATGPAYLSVDTTSARKIFFQGFMSVNTDTIALEGANFTLSPAL